MKKVALIAALVLAVALVMPMSIHGCEDCVSVDFPDPDGPGSFMEWICWDVYSGWSLCTVDGLVASAKGGCHFDVVFLDPFGPFPRQ